MRRPVQRRQRVQQRPGVGVAGVAEQLARPRGLHDPARVHHGDPVGPAGHHAQVVTDQDDRRAQFRPEPAEQVQDLLLHGDVECGGGLVGDQQLRLVRDRHRDHDTLPHPTRELVRVLAEPAARLRDADQPQQLLRAGASGRTGHAGVSADRLGQVRPDLLDRVQRGHRVLEDHPDPGAPQRPAARPVECVHVGPREAHPAGDRDPGPGGVQPHDAAAEHGLARAGLAHDAQCLARPQGERDPVDGGERAPCGAQPGPQVLDDQQRFPGRPRGGTRGTGGGPHARGAGGGRVGAGVGGGGVGAHRRPPRAWHRAGPSASAPSRRAG